MHVSKKLLALAQDGDTDAQCRVADALMGPETPAAYRRAMPWLRRAARNGEAWAAYHLGLIYDNGLGVPCNVHVARRWYQRSADAGYPSAQLNLGVLFANLPGRNRDL